MPFFKQSVNLGTIRPTQKCLSLRCIVPHLQYITVGRVCTSMSKCVGIREQISIFIVRIPSPLQISVNSYINTIPKVAFLLPGPTAFTCLSIFLPTLVRTSVLRIMGHVGDGDRCRHTLANEALVYPSQDGTKRAKGRTALG
jgi:hypothetical protein